MKFQSSAFSARSVRFILVHVWAMDEGPSGTAKKSGEEVVRALYPELEAMIERLLRIGVPLIMFTPQKGSRDASGNRAGRLYSEPYSQHLVQTARVAKELPSHVTLEGCRHGGMTELGDAELTEQEIMSSVGSRYAGGSAALCETHRNAAFAGCDQAPRFGRCENEKGARVEMTDGVEMKPATLI